MHSTSKLNDGYIGSGKILWYSINKYGKENHKFEILENYNSRKELSDREAQLINDDLLKDPLCMNIKHGGEYGNLSSLGGQAIAKKIKEDPDKSRQYHEIGIAFNKKMSENGIRPSAPSWKGKKHSELTKQKMSNSQKGKQEGTLNSQFGTIWITNEVLNLKIKKENPIPEGWRRGRIKT